MLSLPYSLNIIIDESMMTIPITPQLIDIALERYIVLRCSDKTISTNIFHDESAEL